jgi:hypothetical protein
MIFLKGQLQVDVVDDWRFDPILLSKEHDFDSVTRSKMIQ